MTHSPSDSNRIDDALEDLLLSLPKPPTDPEDPTLTDEEQQTYRDRLIIAAIRDTRAQMRSIDGRLAAARHATHQDTRIDDLRRWVEQQLHQLGGILERRGLTR